MIFMPIDQKQLSHEQAYLLGIFWSGIKLVKHGQRFDRSSSLHESIAEIGERH